MSVSKTKWNPVSEPKETPHQVQPHPENRETVPPDRLLNSLKEKQRLFATLKEEGLIHQDKHLKMEAELSRTIQELENLIPQLEVF